MTKTKNPKKKTSGTHSIENKTKNREKNAVVRDVWNVYIEEAARDNENDNNIKKWHFFSLEKLPLTISKTI